MKKFTRCLLPSLVALTILTAAGTAGYACFMRSPQPVQVWLDHIQVEIVDQVAVKTYNCTFKNPNPNAVIGGTCYMELEPGAQIDDMSVLVDGKEMKAEILDVEKAKKVFNDIVKKGGSPALLEYYGNQLIQTQVPRVPPNGTVTVKLTYTTVLKKRGDVIRLQMLNTNPKALMQPLKSASVSVKIRSTQPIKNIYSPTHKIKVDEEKGWDVAVNWSQENYMAKHPFVLYYQTSAEDVGASLVAHCDLDEEGAFMLMLSPTIGSGVGQVSDSEILPKDVVFCVDTSGSMFNNKKMEQARAALLYCIKALRTGDRFNIVDFSTQARQFNDKGLVEVTDESKARALRYVKKLNARGGTAIHEALATSLKFLKDDKRLKMIVFATDGLPTIGEDDPEKILRSIDKKNSENVRIFVFGEGYDVNTKLLDFLALDHRGEADYILPDEDIGKKISHFFDRVGSPIMSDLEISFDGLAVKDVYPREISDIFRGEQVILYGRYTGHGNKTVRLTGTVNGARKTFEYRLNFPEISEDDKSSFVPRLWAGKKVDFLINEIRKSEKPSKELVDEVTYLAKRFGIITPYTSFLMAENITNAQPTGLISIPRPFLRGQILRKLKAANAPGANLNAREKRDRVEDAKAFSAARRGFSGSGGAAAFGDQADALMRKSGRKGTSLSAIRYIGTKTFYKTGEIWFESTFDPAKDKDVKTIKIGSEDYFGLLKKDARVAKYLALGKITLEIKGKWYRIGS